MPNTINPATGEPVWWMKIILAFAFYGMIAAVVFSAFTFGAVNTAAAIMVPIVAAIALADIIWGL